MSKKEQQLQEQYHITISNLTNKSVEEMVKILGGKPGDGVKFFLDKRGKFVGHKLVSATKKIEG